MHRAETAARDAEKRERQANQIARAAEEGADDRVNKILSDTAKKVRRAEQDAKDHANKRVRIANETAARAEEHAEERIRASNERAILAEDHAKRAVRQERRSASNLLATRKRRLDDRARDLAAERSALETIC